MGELLMFPSQPAADEFEMPKRTVLEVDSIPVEQRIIDEFDALDKPGSAVDSDRAMILMFEQFANNRFNR